MGTVTALAEIARQQSFIIMLLFSKEILLPWQKPLDHLTTVSHGKPAVFSSHGYYLRRLPTAGKHILLFY